MDDIANGYEYLWVPAALVDSNVLKECSALYSEHYGTWSAASPQSPGRPIHLSADRIRDWTRSGDTRLAQVRLAGKLIGYAIALQTKVPDWGWISWVTQLVVHKDHRNRGVGKRLLFSIWGFSTHFAWGIISANPYAIRALEKATRRRCSPKRISQNHRKLHRLGAENIPYVKPDTQLEITADACRINTRFFVDHSTLLEKLERATSGETPWLLGTIDEGWEWFAFTFRDQSQIGLTTNEVHEMLRASDDITRQAYSRMLLNEDHKWAQHTEKEVSQVIDYCGLAAGQKVLDLGCGAGRHALRLGRGGIDTIGVDYVAQFVERATTTATEGGIGCTRFIQGDCREIDLHERFDAVLALYDVVGTYADDERNQEILANVRLHLKPGGRALISVMNFAVTEKQATQRFSLAQEPDKLLELPASQTMERTGNIFDPAYYVIENETRVAYRKEQFARGTGLPLEVIVRDRRYRQAEIEGMCRSAGLRVVWSRCVRSGAWENPLDEDDDNAKEILLLCEVDSGIR